MEIVNTFPFSFEGTIFDIYLTDDRKFLVPLKPICDVLGLAWNGQNDRTNRDPVLADHIFKIRAPILRSDGVAQKQEVLCITVQRLHYWFGGISTLRAKPEYQEKLIVWKSRMADALYAYFRSETFPEEVRAELDAAAPPEQREFYRLMEEAAALRRQMGEHGGRLGGLEKRVNDLEMRLVGTDMISMAECQQYLTAVGVLGDMLKEQKTKMASPYAVIHARVKTEFKVPSYQMIPANKFPAVLKYLVDWWKRDAPPGTKVPEIFTAHQDKLL